MGRTQFSSTLATQIMRGSRRLNMVIFSVKWFLNLISIIEVRTDGQPGDYMLPRIFSVEYKNNTWVTLKPLILLGLI